MPPKKAPTITAETQARIQDILQSNFGRRVESIALQPGSNNTQVYTVTIAPGANINANKNKDAKKANTRVTRSKSGVQSVHATKYGTEPLPADITTVILRFTNPGADLNDAVQVQNEVAAYSLARMALSLLDTPVTPRIYGWHAVDMDAKAPGWILEELMSGAALSGEVFGKLDRAAKDSIVADIAHIVHLLQQYRLPDSVVGYGGLDFDEDGQVVTGPTAIHGATKACATYRELYNEYLQTALRRMDECDVVHGWREKSDRGIRARIDAFVKQGFQPLLESSSEANPRPVLVHGDMNMLNFLYDAETSRITALVDWSFSHVASLSDEFFYSFPDLFHIVTPEDPASPMNTIRKAVLHGVDAVAKAEKDAAPMADWPLIEMTNAAFVAAGVTRPADLMPGIDALSDLYWFIQNLSPGLFFMARVRSKMGPQQIQAARQHTRGLLEQTLKRWGF